MNYTALLLSASLAIAGIAPATAQETIAPVETGRNVSLKLEIERSIARGIDYLRKSQSAEGTWSDPAFPALALPLRAIAGDPNRKKDTPLPDWAKKGYAFLISTQKPDGGLYTEKLGSYNTAIGMMALLAANDPAYHGIILKARQYLVGQQHDFGEKGKDDNPLDGGIGYGSHPEPDLSNTNIALEALAKTKKLFDDRGDSAAKDLDWDAALRFVARYQNSPETYDQAWAQSGDASDRGGFIYSPKESKAGEVQLPGGKVGQRSYGSMSYAGLLSMAYADVKAGDPRVQAVLDWVSRHYQIKENPNMGTQGLFYYYHTMAKALVAANVHKLDTETAKGIDWKQDLAVQLFNLQREDGSWLNAESKRWMEDNPALVTAYAILALEHIYYSL